VKRGEFTGLLGGAVAWPLAVHQSVRYPIASACHSLGPLMGRQARDALLPSMSESNAEMQGLLT
jgi:hypothetical protein